MIKFVLDPITVSSKGNVIGSLASDLNDLSSKVASYDISDCEDFDFASAVSSISKNLSAAADKMTNTQSLLTAVVSGHTNLQSSLQYDPTDSSYASYGKPESTSSVVDEKTTSVYVNPRNVISAAVAGTISGSTSGEYSKPSYSTGESSGETMVDGTSTYEELVSSGTPTIGGIPIGNQTSTGGDTPISSGMSKGDQPPTVSETPISGETLTEEQTPTEDIDYEEVLETIEVPENMGNKHGVINWQDINEEVDAEAFKFQSLAGMTFNSGGFAEVNGRYVVACSETFGKVGDYVNFVKEDGTVIECIIGQTIPVTDESSKYGRNNGETIIEFFVDKLSWSEDHPVPGRDNYYSEWNKCIIKAEKVGSYFDNDTDRRIENASGE